MPEPNPPQLDLFDSGASTFLSIHTLHRIASPPMIRNFTDRDTGQLFRTERNRRFTAIARVALRA
jgi:hypothetical protein